MRAFVGTALLGAAGLLALSLSAHAAGATSVTDSAAIKSPNAQYMQLAQSTDQGGRYKKSTKKKSKKKKSKKKMEEKKAS